MEANSENKNAVQASAQVEQDGCSAESSAEEFEQLKLPDEHDNATAEGDSPLECKPQGGDDDIDEEAMRQLEQSLSEEELLANKATSDRLKLQGNELFKNDQAQCSIELYTEALQLCPTRHNKERAILYANRAAAKIKLEAKKSAIDDCTKAIDLWPEYVRALLRRAKLFEHDEKLDDALADYKRVSELEPGQREACEALVRLPPIIKERNEKLKDEMMSKLKDLGNMFLKPFGLSTSSFQMQQDPSTGSYSINFNQGGGGSGSGSSS